MLDKNKKKKKKNKENKKKNKQIKEKNQSRKKHRRQTNAPAFDFFQKTEQKKNKIK
jgi:hypothetical protein